MAGMVANSALVLDQLSHPWQGPQTRLVAKRFGASLQSALDLAQVIGRQASLPPAPAGRVQARGPSGGQHACPATDGLPMHPNLPRHVGLTPPCLQQLRRLQAAALQSLKVAFDSPRVSHEGTLHEKCRNVTI